MLLGRRVPWNKCCESPQIENVQRLELFLGKCPGLAAPIAVDRELPTLWATQKERRANGALFGAFPLTGL